jgi:hypothetical protein
MKAPILLVFVSMVFLTQAAPADQVTVRYAEGLLHGFLILRQEDGTQIADGEAFQVERAGRVTNHLIFRFKDGSIYEETTVYTQRSAFRLLSDHVIEKGPAFKTPMDSSIDAMTGQVTVRYQEGGKEKVSTERLKLPPDVANGMIFTLVKDIKTNSSSSFSYLATMPKPRLVKLVFTPEGDEPVVIGGASRTAIHYRMKVDLGGVARVVAPIIGKQPPDTQIWVIGGEAPTVVGWEGPLYSDGPVWRIELVSPVRKNDTPSGGNKN